MSKNNKYLFFDEPLELYNSILYDLEIANRSIFIETYVYGDDEIGLRFKDMLIKKAQQGLKVILIIDSWGSNVSSSYFNDFEKSGGKIKFFKKINILRLDYFTETHRRDHRKLIIIDNQITYIGSANINSYCLNWKESVLRIEDNDLSSIFSNLFYQNLSISYKYYFNKYPHIKEHKHNNFKIIRDVPSNLIQNIKTVYINLINNAKKSIIIETPYFLPGTKVIRSLINATMRGVDVHIIMPKHSDILLMDILRDRYLGMLHTGGVQIHYYSIQNLHAKLMLVDDLQFTIGSANFDYRSFRFQFEIILYGKDKIVFGLIKQHILKILDDCENFNFELWKQRPFFQRLFEKFLLPFRHLF